MYLIKTGGKLDWAGAIDSMCTSLMTTLIRENESYAIDMLLNWKVLTCNTVESMFYIDHCVHQGHKTVLKRLLREPTMDVVAHQYPQNELISQSWISDIYPAMHWKLQKLY